MPSGTPQLPTPAIARTIRLEAGLFQEALARRVRCSTKSVNAWESGKTTPSGLLGLRYSQVLRELAAAPPAWWAGDL